MLKIRMGTIFCALLLASLPVAAADDLHGLFQDKCRMCHTSYESLAKIKLTLKSGRLVGLYTGHDIGEFMIHHGRLTEDQARAVTERMARLTSALETGGSKGRQKRGRKSRTDQ